MIVLQQIYAGSDILVVSFTNSIILVSEEQFLKTVSVVTNVINSYGITLYSIFALDVVISDVIFA